MEATAKKYGDTTAMTRSTPPVTQVPLLDVSRSHDHLREEILDALAQVVNSGRFLYGPQVTELEKEVADYCGVRHAVGCASGSDALLLSLMLLDLQPGDEVIVPSFTFFATASAVTRLGATPVFVDVDPDTYNLCPVQFQQAITPRTKAVIPVHLFGQCAAIDVICEIADRHGFAVIEDAAQAIGARYNGKAAGGWGRIGCFSFYPTKNLGAFGDGGMITTNCADTAERLRVLACHGMKPRYYHSEVGVNSRLDTMQAAVLQIKLRELQTESDARRANAGLYRELLATAAPQVTCPQESRGCTHVWNQFTVRVAGGQRDELRRLLASRNIGSEVYYPVPLHLQACFRAYGYEPGSLPHTEQAAEEVLSLPIFGGLTDDEIRYVADAVHHFAAQSQPTKKRAA